MPSTPLTEQPPSPLAATSPSPLPPCLSQGSSEPLGIHSTVGDLPLYTFTVSGDRAISDIITYFTQLPDLPGVVVIEAGRVNVLSRQQFLETWLQFGQTAGFTSAPIHKMLNPDSCRPVIFSRQQAILSGARRALKRPTARQSDPLLVQHTQELKTTYHLLDAHTLNIAHWQIRGIETQIRYEKLQMQLLQSEKMAALGRLVDGVAHEILDPVSFIWGNLRHIATYTEQQSALIAAYEAAYKAVVPKDSAEIEALKEDIEFDYVRSDLPAALASAQSGAHRLRQLASSLQNFCHIDEIHPRPTDINTLLDSTLRLLKSRLTTPISIERSYGKLPPVPCYSGQLSQVFMNIFTNAVNSLLAQAQQEVYLRGETYEPENELMVPENSQISQGKTSQSQTDSPHPESVTNKLPQITVTTCVFTAGDGLNSQPDEARWVSIIISDNGPGLEPQTKADILDSFSTRSRSHKETGLAMSYQIVTAKHGGKFWMRSRHASEDINSGDQPPTTGTEFEILLPLTLEKAAK